ncbi:MAG: hypothetical protein ACRDOY_06275, partial [Nocardioidaceae bacterium]
SAPYERGLRLAVQIRKAGGTWRTVTRPAVGVTGRSYAGVTFPTAGTWYLRAYRPPTTKISRGRSPVWTVRVG